MGVKVPCDEGLRIDGFAASKRVMVRGGGEVEGQGSRADGEGGGGVKVRVVDGFILDQLTVGASDHAPIGVTLAL